MNFAAETYHWLIPFLLLVICGLVQGLAGFGAGLLAVATLSLIWDFQQVVAVGNVFGLLLAVGILWAHRDHVQKSILSPLVVTTVIGVPIGLTLLTGVSKSTMSLLLGSVLTGYAIWSLVTIKRATHHKINEKWGYLAGLLGGMLCAAFNTAGPPVLIFASERGWPKEQYKSSLQAYFLLTGGLTTMGLAAKGIINAETLQWNLILAPAVIIGAVSGHFLGKLFAPEVFKKMVLLMLLAMGVYYLGSWI